MSSETASVHLSTYRCCWLADTNRFSRTDVKNKNLQICLKAKHLFPKRYRTVLAGYYGASREQLVVLHLWYRLFLTPLCFIPPRCWNLSLTIHPGSIATGPETDPLTARERVWVFPHRPRSGRACWSAGRSALCRWSGARTPCRGRGRRWRISAASRTTADRTGPWCRRRCAWRGDRC